MWSQAIEATFNQGYHTEAGEGGVGVKFPVCTARCRAPIFRGVFIPGALSVHLYSYFRAHPNTAQTIVTRIPDMNAHRDHTVYSWRYQLVPCFP